MRVKEYAISVYQQIGTYARKHPYVFSAVAVLMFIGMFLRFYNVGEFVVFLGDQGRDAILMKRLITFENLPAIGAPSSVGQIFLGPFYYYFAAPFLLLFNFNPVGPAYGVALMSVIGLLASFLIIKRETNAITALLFLILAVFSGVNVSLSRFSWNPNLLPFFSFLTLYLFYLAFAKRSLVFAGVFGLLYAFSTQLHHLGFLIVLPCIFITGYELYIQRSKKKDLISLAKVIGVSIGAFTLGNAPLILFDLKNRFINITSYFRLFTEQEQSEETTAWIYRAHETVGNFFFHTLQFHADKWVWYSILILTMGLFVYLYLKQKKRNLFLLLNLLLIPLYLFVFSLVPSFHYAHYYGSLYYSLFFVWAFIGYQLVIQFKKTSLAVSIIGCALLGIYVFLNFASPYYNYLRVEGSNQVERARTIAASIVPEVTELPYQVVALPSTETSGHVRYYLEILGDRPLAEESPDEAAQIIVLCPDPGAECEPLGTPQWQLAAFHNPEIEKEWTVEGVRVFKIVHKNN